ncbi:tRNA epoxyqueuosine(34) reductase QueG [Nitrogeniibacter mangrovi]|nr:tRNA epoxyqueuosine(34) reductase QueG [Nitrogeniibacter mangrovi]
MGQFDHQALSPGQGGAASGAALVDNIRAWARELGFGAIGISGVDLPAAEAGLQAWLEAGFHGEMDYMAKHGLRRCRPAELLPGTRRVITARLDYWPGQAAEADGALADGTRAYVSRYALGRDYHKVLRNRLKKLAERIAVEVPHQWRVFTDSAPVAEVALATESGLGWRGKHTLLLSREAGSYFFLGEIFTDLALPVTAPVSDHCGQCSACIDVCPTRAIVAPYRVDARRCISYLTIELHGAIPEALRPLIGNRVYGCDDCQLVCPWNRFAQPTQTGDFEPRHGLDAATLVELFAWTEAEFAEHMAGSPIYRIGHARWLRNLAVGLGNAPWSADVVAALEARRDDSDPLVREHVGWALAQQAARKP